MHRNNKNDLRTTFTVMLLTALAAIAALTGLIILRPRRISQKAAPSAPILSPDVRGAVLSGDAASIFIRPAGSFAEGMELTFSGEKITPEGSTKGGFLPDGTWSDSADLLTTSWFPVAAAKKSLYIIGGLNCAVWEFADASDTRTVWADKGDFMDMESVDTAKRSWSAAEIPADAVRCRVTYRDETLERTVSDTGIMIAYGSIPDGYTDAPRVTVTLPDLKAGQVLTCDGAEWTLWSGETAVSHPDLPPVPISAGTVITMAGSVPGELCVEYAETPADSKEAIACEYGVRHSGSTPIPVCQRLGDARFRHMDYTIAGKWQAGGTNDFDTCYPWSAIRRCCISADDGGSRIIYEGDPAFRTDGSAGNVMVEIPKFYVKRTQDDAAEEIWISGTCHPGYVIDPAFEGEGRELDAIYISAYVGSMDETDGRLVSVSGAWPEIQVPYSDFLAASKKNGEGFRSLSFLAYQAVGKLFLVEAGTLDSTSLIAGFGKSYFYHEPAEGGKDLTCTAVDSARSTHTIKIENSAPARKIDEGSSVILLSLTDGWDAYSAARTSLCRNVLTRKKDGDYLIFTLDGEAFDTAAGETVLSSYPTMTGETDGDTAPTSVFRDNSGRHGFRYRYMENIYGTALTLLDSDAWIADGILHYIDGSGHEQTVPDPVPVQTTTLNASEKGFTMGNINCIRRMSFDPEHPTVMVPAECGASSYEWYGDYFLYRPKGDGRKYYIAVGGASDNARLCGIFQMRGLIGDVGYKGNFHCSRIMFSGR